MFNGIYSGKKVLVTGHTGFKGSWLALWLKKLGAFIGGYALEAPTKPSHWEVMDEFVISAIADIRNKEKVLAFFESFKPDIVFHMAAQPLVRKSYLNPSFTYETNVIGTLNVFEASRLTDSVKALVNITSDKCYENKEWEWGYRENDRLGGYDIYSSSKACSEILTASYSRSFFNPETFGKEHNTLIASARAGNVIGGGDWAEDRLVPDIIKATVEKRKVNIRNPMAVRPWQHVLEPLYGYLLLGEKLLNGRTEYAQAWNFGPLDGNTLTVKELVRLMKLYWDDIDILTENLDNQPHEATLLKLDIAKAKKYLGWHPVWDINQTIEKTVTWYKYFYSKNKTMSNKQLIEFVSAIRH